MDDILVIGAGPAGLLAAWVARRRGARVKLLASGIGTTHVSPGWISVLADEAGTRTSADERGQAVDVRAEYRAETFIPQVGIEASAGFSGPRAQPAKASIPEDHLTSFVAAHPDHPYALAGMDALRGGIAALREVGQAAGLSYVGDLSANFCLPTVLGAVAEAALVPESFAAGDLRQPGPMLIAGPAGWRDFYPKLCAGNLAGQGYAAQGVYFDLPELAALSQFDVTPVGLANLFERADVRARVAAQLKPRLNGATRVGLPAVLGLAHAAAAWRDLQDRLGVPVFEIPTLPPSVPGIRLFNAFKAALTQAGVQILLDMTAVRGVAEGSRATGVIVPNVVRDRTYRADTFILATGGLYGGGITSDYTGALREAVFALPVQAPVNSLNDRFAPQFLGQAGHPIHRAGVRVNAQMQPIDESSRVVLENLHIAGRLLAAYDPLTEGSTEGVWLATAYRAAHETLGD